MRKYRLTVLFLICAGNLFAGTKQDSTWYRERISNEIRYIVLPENPTTNLALITQVHLGKILYAPGFIQATLKVDVYNVLFKNYLAVFSLMPSYTSMEPVWKKISLDSIKTKTLNLVELKSLIETNIAKSPPKEKTKNNLKYYNYALVIKGLDGWYCSNTDCFTEFFQVMNDPSRSKNKSYQINVAAPLLSVAEYEAAYRRKNGNFSENYPFLRAFNKDAIDGDLLYHSLVDTVKAQKQHHYWIMSSWGHDGSNLHRGMERFIFVPGTGVITASYDFFMPRMLTYWQSILNKQFTLAEREKAIKNAEFTDNFDFLNYMNEYTLPQLNKP